ncbi:GMC family oxidoreductase N-terminal domain-containing protein [Sphingomonas sp. BGYR3]|uniref:GMC family oxidoreductase n=1 Tax=Sphingomonas sp. BGYR3 TaxID=2975483 RepID=UPI0021A71019|nr:GMC family oxidoreductase N-terminal domain-containing protein [Sphingomonas sp. BGYR3]MDG5487794.1 GMC family oxidoreductase N-terminal domain-containing protein [Sphingomonas sp. BGYR3]
MTGDFDKDGVNAAAHDLSTGAIDRRAFIARATMAGMGLAAANALSLAAGPAFAQSTRTVPVPRSADYIVIGAGTAGGTLAGELARRTGANVLVLEAGPSDEVPQITDPARWPEALALPFTKGYETAPQRHADNRKIAYPRGEGLGGCGSVNCMIYARGVPGDFDSWAQDGATAWDWASVLPDYKALEDWQGGASDLRGAGGPLHITRPDPAKGHEGAQAFIAGAKSLGYEENYDINGPKIEGPAWVNFNIYMGKRQNSAAAFLRPALEQGAKLSVLTDAPVLRLLIEKGRCVGVEYLHGGKPVKVRATREVILSAGAIMTPKILTLSGIGDPAQLRKLGIAPVAGLRGVGANLSDHVLGAGVNFEAQRPLPPTAYNHSEVYMWWRSQPGLARPDITALYVSLPFATPELGLKRPNCYAILSGVMRPEARGSVTITSADPRAVPVIDPNFLGTEQDIAAFKAATELARAIGNSSAYGRIRKEEVLPGAQAADPASYRAFLKKAAATFYHPVGTAKMGSGPDAVVDPQLRVHGIAGLRVADASVMPSITTSNTNAPSFLIGYRGARLIAGG